MIENKKLFENIKRKFQEYHYDDGEATAYFRTFVRLRDLKEGEEWTEKDLERAADMLFYRLDWIYEPEEKVSGPIIPAYVYTALIDVFKLRDEDRSVWEKDDAELGEEMGFFVANNKLEFYFEWSGKITFSGDYYPAVLTADPYYSSPAEGEDESEEAAYYLADEFKNSWQKEISKHLKAEVEVEVLNIEY